MSIETRDEATVVLRSVLDCGKVLGMSGNIEFYFSIYFSNCWGPRGRVALEGGLNPLFPR